jgi:uncharacterized membrane protein
VKHTAHVVLIAASLLWCGGIMLPAFLADTHPAGAVMMRMVYAPICHQKAERSFSYHGHPFSVCERCASVYFAAAVVFVLYPFRRRLHLPSGISFPLLLLCLLPMLCDRLLAFSGLAHSGVAVRVATGIAAGAGFGFFLPPAWMEAWRQLAHPRLSSSPYNMRSIHE